MSISGVVHKSANLVHSKAKVGSGESEVLKSTYKASKRCKVKEGLTLSWGEARGGSKWG